jgi:predicted glycosyltransferase
MYKNKEVKTRIIATGPCIANQLRDVNTICRRSWYIAAHVWKIAMHFHIVKMYKDKEVKNVNNFFVNV